MMRSSTELYGIAEDVRDLQRGVLVTYLGYALKLALPILIAFATRAYGAEGWGIFIAAQAVVLIAARVCLFGLDKALLWAVPGRERAEALLGVRPALYRVAAHASIVCVAVQLGPALLPNVLGIDGHTLRVAVWGLLPFVLSELLLHATMGLRRMELQVAVRETLNPAVQVGVALLLFRAGKPEKGLAWGFVVSQSLGLLVSWWGFRRLFAESPLKIGSSFVLPPRLLSYAWLAWLAEITNSFLLRLDTVVLALLCDPKTVGVWGVVAQFGNALRQMRRAYDPVVTAITARIARQHDARRLADAFSYAAQMVSLTQLPVFAGLVCFGDVVLPLYGPDFAQGAGALSVLAGFFLLSGGAGLSGLVVSGYGKSGWMLVNALLTVALQLALLIVLVPRFGLLGAAVSVGVALCIVNLVQLLEMKLVTGSFNFTGRSRFSFAVLIGSCAGMLAGSLLADALALDAWWKRSAAMLGFALVYLPLGLHGLREGVLRAPQQTPRASGEMATIG